MLRVLLVRNDNVMNTVEHVINVHLHLGVCAYSIFYFIICVYTRCVWEGGGWLRVGRTITMKKYL